MLKTFLYVVCFLLSLTYSQDVSNRARLVNPESYYIQVMEEMIHEMEDREWCNFTMENLTQTLDDVTHTNVVVNGEVYYTNGFLVSVQKLDLVNMLFSLSSSTQNGVVTSTALFRGSLNLHDARIGYDVTTNLTTESHPRKYTGIFTHSLIRYRFDLMKNMNTDEITASTFLESLSAGSGVRMVYMPEDEISQVLSLRFLASGNWNGVQSWLRDIMTPRFLDIARNKVPFPDICFNC